MIDLSPKHKDKLSVVVKKQQEAQLKFIERIKPHRGHTLFELNKSTKEIKKAKFEQQDIHFNADVKRAKKRRVLIANDDCFYVSALNLKNAQKKLIKMGFVL